MNREGGNLCCCAATGELRDYEQEKNGKGVGDIKAKASRADNPT